MRIFGDIQSGNCYKIKLLLSLLEQDHDWVHVNILAGETHTPEYLEMNPNGKIPVLETNDGNFLCESNAILNYLAAGTQYLPESDFEKAQVLQWQFFEQYSHEPYIAVARYISKYLGLPADRRAEYESKQNGGNKALAVMEQQLEKSPYFVGDRLTIADISLFGYTHVAHEGGFNLENYPNLLSWISRINSEQNFIGME